MGIRNLMLELRPTTTTIPSIHQQQT